MSDTIDLLVISTSCHTAVNRNIYRKMRDGGMSVVLVVPKRIKFPSGYIESAPPRPDDPPIIFLEMTKGGSRVCRFVGINDILDKHRPKNVLLDLDPVSVSALIVGIWCRGNGARLSCISCENMPLDLFFAFKNRGVRGIPATIVKRILLFINARLVDCVFTINDEGTEIFRKEGFGKVKKIPLGFDPSIFKKNDAARTRIRGELGIEGVVLGFFGRVTFEKGVHILLDALITLKSMEWTLLMDEFNEYKGDFHSDLSRQITDAGLSDRIVFINPKHVEMGDYMNAVDLVVMPSISTRGWIEQYGRIAAESMACGKLVVASNTGALPMLLNGHGVLVSEGDVAALADALKKFILNGQSGLSKLSSAEISGYATKFLSIDAQIEAMTECFDRQS